MDVISGGCITDFPKTATNNPKGVKMMQLTFCTLFIQH